MSFQIEVNPKEEAGTRTIMKIFRELQRAYLEERKDRKLTQQEIARRLDVNRSVVNRRLQGKENLTVRSLGELMWAMDRDWIISSEKSGGAATGNIPTGTVYNEQIIYPNETNERSASASTPYRWNNQTVVAIAAE